MLCLGAMGGLALSPVPARASVTQAQTIKVKGQVVDESGEPLIGATVKIKGSKDGTVTDLDGNFTINTASNATLVISYVGYKEREVAVRGRAVIDQIEMSADNNTLDQVVVVGYGTQKKADLTGSVAVVNADEMKKVSNSNISTMLEGRLPACRLPPTDNREPTRRYASAVSAPLAHRLLCMLSTVCLWVRPFVTSRLMISPPYRS